MPLSAESTQAVKSILDDATKQGPTGVNGLVFVAVDKNGETLVEHASGTRSVDSEVPMDMDTNFCKFQRTRNLARLLIDLNCSRDCILHQTRRRHCGHAAGGEGSHTA